MDPTLPPGPDIAKSDEERVRAPRIVPQLTETIDLSQLGSRDVTESGSFAVQGISSTAIGGLLDALPIPVLCLEGSFIIQFANKACSRITSEFQQLQGSSILSIMPRSQDAALVRSAAEMTFSTRKPRVVEGLIRKDKGNMWGRMHFRSLRILGERLVLVQIEDLTPQKRELILRAKYQEELQRSVMEATVKLSSLNEGLKKEIAFRSQAEQGLKESLTRFKKTLDGTVKALASIAEKRDPYTAGHQRRVARLSSAIAKAMGLPENRVEGIGIAASMHDVGKICVPAELLSKPGRLSGHEYGIIMAHPEIGYDILKVVEFPWPLAEIALQHHERINGTGYPRGLKSDDILLEARIVAVADVVEAMSSHRPYRPMLGLREAVREIHENRGILYDKAVVDACLSIMRNGLP
jgi:HD-GYP domain-containing protein (c-di-GMP phosphodiesterase class II)